MSAYASTNVTCSEQRRGSSPHQDSATREHVSDSINFSTTGEERADLDLPHPQMRHFKNS